MPIAIHSSALGSASVQSISVPAVERPRCDVTLLGKSLETVRNTPTYSSVLQRAPRSVPSMAHLGPLQSGISPSSRRHALFALQLQGAANVGSHQAPGQSSPTESAGFSGQLSGFANTREFSTFGAQLRDGLSKAGYENVEPILQGSAVTGKNFRTGTAFDVRRISDFDVALAGPDLLKKAESLGIGLRSGGRRTGPLGARDLARLGLKELTDRLGRQAGREVNFMIFGSVVSATSRAPSVILPK